MLNCKQTIAYILDIYTSAHNYYYISPLRCILDEIYLKVSDFHVVQVANLTFLTKENATLCKKSDARLIASGWETRAV